MFMTEVNYNSGGGCMLQCIKLHDGELIRHFVANEEGLCEYSTAIYDLDGDVDSGDYEMWHVSYDNDDALQIIEDHCRQYTPALIEVLSKFFIHFEPPVMKINFGKSIVAVALHRETFMFVFEPNNNHALICQLDPNKSLLQHLMFADFQAANASDYHDWRRDLIDDTLFDLETGR